MSNDIMTSIATISGVPVPCTSLWISINAVSPGFHMAVATVTYAILSTTSSQSWQMADIQTEGILYKNGHVYSLFVVSDLCIIMLNGNCSFHSRKRNCVSIAVMEKMKLKVWICAEIEALKGVFRYIVRNNCRIAFALMQFWNFTLYCTLPSQFLLAQLF